MPCCKQGVTAYFRWGWAMANMNKPLATLAAELRNGDLSAQALMEGCFEAYAASEFHLNAYKTWAGDTALIAAKQVDQLLKQGYDFGPLMGVPISVKDMFALPNLPTYAGSKSALGAEWQQPGELVQALRSQLALITGKTHTVEFALGGIGVNAHWGTPRNPWDVHHHRIPGGSSSGAVVSLCQGSALLALGTDTAGSVRIPASVTGKVGLKTTVGHWPTNQIVPLSASLDTPGVLANTLEDLCYAYAAIEKQLHKQPLVIPKLNDCRGVRIGIPENFFWEDADKSVIALVKVTMRRLEQAGAQLIPIQVPLCAELFADFQQGGLSVPELAYFLSSRLPEKLEELDPVVKMRVQDGGAITALEYLRRKALVEQATQQAAVLFEQVDIWLHPTIPISPPKLTEIAALEDYRRANMLALRNPSIANLMGLCALSMPVGLDNLGMPVGMQLTAAGGQETKLLAIAQAFEHLLGNGQQLMGVCPLF